ncbi:hypothetical protein LV164_002892 [Aspergillus fumigatus]|nr:hypothetical protein KXX42_001686 [Aspergillus fumigatus]KAH1557404.1 hypothetical protein KXX57_006566 [Aspergillus fumigatus]KAH2317508.1 hypothetical protein KXV47_008547 [Aspergillus fumigatus]KAH3028064.1 hypothetical protein KXW60_003359 [Aspergillus fumigatus]KAH3148023.1 hypothetical protein KXW18_003751 [Aspergillus fumigatus]
MGEGKALDNATFTRTTLLGGCVAHAIDPTAARSMFCNAALFLGSAVGETCRPGHGNLSASPGKTALTSSDTPSLALFTVKMIQLKTLLNCIDNSGAAVVECVNVLKKKRPATVGDRIVVVVQKQRNFGPESTNNSGIANKVRRGDIRHAVVVRAKKEMQRPDGTIVKFDDNACVLVNKSGDPIGTRMNGVVATELRGKQWSKILSLAPMHV